MKNNSKSPRPTSEETEISPGIICERRSVLAGLGALLACGFPASGRTAGMSYAEFLAAANPLAQSLVADATASGQDRYLQSLAALASQIVDMPVPDVFNDTNQGTTPESYQIGFNPGGDPFTVLHWRLEPGAVCRPHAHTYGNVVSVGLQGLVRVSNYEVVGTPDYGDDSTFVVRQTVDQLLGPGDINLVSLQRNYIHGFVAGPDGARGLDITTRLKPRPDHGTPYLDRATQPLNAFLRTFEARWIYYG